MMANLLANVMSMVIFEPSPFVYSLYKTLYMANENFKVGDIVLLPTGTSPKMSIEYLEGEKAWVVWYNNLTHLFVRDSFPIACLYKAN